MGVEGVWTLQDADDRAKHAEAYTARREQHSELIKRLEALDKAYGFDSKDQEIQLLIDAIKFLLNNVEFRKIY